MANIDKKYHSGEAFTYMDANDLVEAVNSATAESEKSATSAREAEKSAAEAQSYLNTLNDNILNLPDGQAVSAQVAKNTGSIGGLDSILNGGTGVIVADTELGTYKGLINADGSKGSSSATFIKPYYIDGATSVSATVQSSSPKVVIAFYNAVLEPANLKSTNLISLVQADTSSSSIKTYTADVPAGTKTIAVVSLLTYTKFSVKITGHVEGLVTKVENKLDKPVVEGTVGQVLSVGESGYEWANPSSAVDSFEDNDYSFLDGATTHVLTKNGNPIKPMTDFNSVFDAEGKSLAEFGSDVSLKLSELAIKVNEVNSQINGGNILEYKKTINANSGQAILSSSNKFNVDFKNGDDIIVHIIDSNNVIQPADSGCNIQFFAADGSLIEANTASTNNDISIKLTDDVALIGMYVAASKVVSDGTIILKVVKPSTIPKPIVKQISDIQKSVADANSEIAALSLSVSQAESEVNEVNSQINGGDLVVKSPVMTAGGLFYGAIVGRQYSEASNFLADVNSHYAKIDIQGANKVIVEYENINTGSSSQTLVLDKDMNILFAVQEKNITLVDGKYKIEVNTDKAAAAYLYISCKNATKVLSYTYQVDGKFAELEKKISVLQQGSTTIDIDFANKINGYVVASTGKMADGAGSFFHTQPMSVVKGQTVKFNAKGYNNVVAMVAKVLPTDYATLVTSVDSNQRDYVYEVTEDCDIIICFDNRASASGNIYIDVPAAIAAHTSAKKSVLVGASRPITTIKAAVEQANALALSGYEVDIVIDKGTYDAFEGFSLASESSSFVGLLLENNVNIIGNGDASEIIINGALPKNMSEYAYQRNKVAVFNSWRNNSYKNITINATNMRYCIHNDWSPNSQHIEDAYELYEGVILNSYQDADVDTKAAAWPIGSAACNGRVTEFRFCIFNNAANTDHCVNIHNRRNSTKPCKWIFESCQMIGGKNGAFYIGSEGTHQRDIVSIKGCKIPNAIILYALSGYTGDNEMNLCGYGNLLNGFDYRTGITEDSGKEMLIL